MSAVEVKCSIVLLSCFTSHTVNKRLFHGLSSATFSQFCALVGALLFKMAPKHSIEMLSSVLKHKKVVIFLMETMHELDKLIQA